MSAAVLLNYYHKLYTFMSQRYRARIVCYIIIASLVVGSVGVTLVASPPTASAHVITAKTKASFTATTKPSTVTVDETFTVGFTLADANTTKRLSKKTITIYYAAVGESDWVSLGQFKTNKKGRSKIELSSPASIKFKARWKPTGADAQKYKTTTSNTVIVTVE